MLPNLLYGIGQGAVIPIVPVLAIALDASLSIAALVVAALTIGQLCATLPSSWLIERAGEHRAMLIGATLVIAGSILCIFAPHLALLAAGVFLIGMASGIFMMARHTYLTLVLPPGFRGRGLSMVAGSYRLGFAVGPFASALAMGVSGDTRSAFAISAGAATLLVLSLLVRPERTPTRPRGGQAAGSEEPSGAALWRTFRQRGNVLLTIGVAAALIGGIRICRLTLVPIVGLLAGLTPAEVSLVVGGCALVDFSLFYTGGQILDRFGRVWAALTNFTLSAISLTLLGLAVTLRGSLTIYLIAALGLAVASGMAAGLINTIGSDLADPTRPAPFLSAWKLVTQSGPATTPFLVSAVIVFSAAAPAWVMAALCVGGAFLMARYLPRFLPRDGDGTVAAR